MTRDDIIRMAREAGMVVHRPFTIAHLRDFAALVAAAEREACIECIGRIAAYTVDPIDRARLYEAMDAIRARGTK
jgi:AmiR/NasT family two-component response regulator